MRVVVIGARGQLGAAMVRECASRHEVVALDRVGLDISDEAAVFAIMARERPDAILNCTGYNAVDAAEDHPTEALAVNAIAVRVLTRAATEVGAPLVHFSSDFVFDGSASTPMTEADTPNPRSVYATSKLLGEWLALDSPQSYVLRVESLFGEVPGAAPKGSVAGIVQALRAGRVPKVFQDRTVSPTYVFDAARATRELLERRHPSGLYHCVNTGHATWLEFATEAARLLGVEPRFDVVRFADVTLPAARPQYCALSNRKLISLEGIEMPTWQDALARYVQSTLHEPRA
jgi:dTDP-4-dehydrorhamnose reductase